MHVRCGIIGNVKNATLAKFMIKSPGKMISMDVGNSFLVRFSSVLWNLIFHVCVVVDSSVRSHIFLLGFWWYWCQDFYLTMVDIWNFTLQPFYKRRILQKWQKWQIYKFIVTWNITYILIFFITQSISYQPNTRALFCPEPKGYSI